MSVKNSHTSIMTNENVAALHKVLHYLLTKAAVGGKLGKTTVRIPISDLAETVGQTDTRDVDLVVTIALSWDEGSPDATVDEQESQDSEESYD